MNEAFSWAKYALKAVVALVVAAGGALAVATNSDSVGGSSIVVGEWVTIAVAAIIAGAAVFAVENAPSGVLYAAKAIIAGVTAFAATFAPALVDGIVAQEWVTIGIAVLVAVVGVFYAANGEKPVTSVEA